MILSPPAKRSRTTWTSSTDFPTLHSPFYPSSRRSPSKLTSPLVPEGDEKDWPVFQKYLPEMRDRIQQEMGVRVPGVRIRSNETDFSRGTYLVLLDEIPVLSGHVEPDMRYCPESPATLGSAGLKEALNPLTSGMGCWAPPERWDQLRASGHELWEPLLYVINHLEAVLRRDLRTFLGVQETENLIEQWEEQEREFVREALPSGESRAFLRVVLRELLREGVPIADWKAILNVLKASEHPGVEATVRATRFALKSALPGNQPQDTRVALPTSVEHALEPWLVRYHERTFLAIPPEETQEVLRKIRALVQEQGDLIPRRLRRGSSLRGAMFTTTTRRNIREVGRGLIPTLLAAVLLGLPAPTWATPFSGTLTWGARTDIPGGVEGAAGGVAALKKAKPKKASVEFGLEIAVEAGKLTALLMESSGTATLKIALEWGE